MVQGLENDVDWFFFDHFNMHLSRVLSLFTDKNNPFKGIEVCYRDFQPGSLIRYRTTPTHGYYASWSHAFDPLSVRIASRCP